MATKSERETILDSIEDDYRHDLSIHLYSTFLLHQLNPLFPSRNWASWPLRVSEVPDPRTSTTYADTILSLDHFKEDIDDQALKESQTENYCEVGSSDSDEVAEGEDFNGNGDNSNSDGIDDSDDDEEERIDNRQIMKIRTVSFKETLSNSKSNLINELNSLIERKIYDRLKAINKKPDVISSEISPDLTKKLCQSLANKVDKVFNHLIELNRSSTSNNYAKRSFLRLFNWQDVLIAGLNVEESPYRNFQTKLYSNLYKKCEKLFENVKFRYEYDDNENETETVTSSILQERGHDPDNMKRAFNVTKYLDELERLNTSNAVYKDFKEKILRKKYLESKLKEYKKSLFLKKLQLQDKYKEMTWDKKRIKISDGQKNRKRFKINTDANNKDFKDLALNHGGLQLDENDYIIEIN